MTFSQYRINYPITVAYEKAKQHKDTRKIVDTIDDIIGVYRQSHVTIKRVAYDKLISNLSPVQRLEAKDGMRWHYASVVPV